MTGLLVYGRVTGGTAVGQKATALHEHLIDRVSEKFCFLLGRGADLACVHAQAEYFRLGDEELDASVAARRKQLGEEAPEWSRVLSRIASGFVSRI